jgi:hypothetical protein
MIDDSFARLPGPDPIAMALKQELSEIILWNEQNSPRSKQLAVGPSELGDACDRRLAYRIAGIPAVNTASDPWPAIVGTSIHQWLEKAINQYQEANGDLGWRTELRVYPDPLVQGSSDVFNIRTGVVLDHKSTGTDVMRKLKKGGAPPPGYITQIQLYGLGHANAGRKVERVALIFYPRSGWLSDVYVWSTPYDEAVARAALDRMYRIGHQLIELQIESNHHRFQFIEATPGDSCTWCAHYSMELGIDVAASGKGCPGR